MPEKRPHVTNLATFVKNRSNLACTPQCQHQVPHKISARSELVVKSTSLKRGSQTIPEGSVSEHINFSTIKKAPNLFFTYSHHQNNITCAVTFSFYTTCIFFSFLFEKFQNIAPRRLPPLGVDTFGSRLLE